MFSIVQKPLDLSVPIVARRAMRVAGRDHARGEVIDWRALNVKRARLDDLYRCRMIENRPAPAVAPSVEETLDRAAPVLAELAKVERTEKRTGKKRR